ncbi:hypothetical protein D1007_05622 [Hordeum vulgare]|nr:hypothetical protein D1007_05622 [Hordeum vulgare]
MKKSGIHIASHESGEVEMARFTWENPQYVENELEFYWKRGVEKRKKRVKKDEVVPLTVIPIESELKEEEECQNSYDPTTDAFWE